MTSNPSLHDRPPLRIQPPSQTIPRIPFSSPIVDEVSSPSSSSSHGRPTLYGRRAYTQNEVEREKTRPPRRSSSVQRRPGEIRAHNSEKINRSRPPGLNLVTDFSKPAMMRHDTRHNRTVGPDTNMTERGFVDEAYIDRRKTESRRRTQAKGDVKGPVHSLKRAASSKIFELSPSDREVIIGLSVASTRHAGYSLSSEKDGQPTGIAIQQYATGQDPPITPSIVITPAKDEAPWHDESERHQQYQLRPASSIYSRATHYGRGVSQMTNIPPVPIPPTGACYFQKPTDSKTVEKRPSTNPQPRVISTYTELGNDGSPPNFADGRPYSGESQLGIFNRSSLDTITTKRRSQGWWNYVVSPFVSRSGTWRTAASPRIGEKVPDIGHAVQITAESDSLQKGPIRQDTGSEKERVKSDCTVWTDLSRWETEREKARNSHDDKAVCEDLDHGNPQNLASPEQSSPEQTEGFGAASEYYRACWHDQNSPTAYFKCHNHVCLPADAVLQGSDTTILDTNAGDGEEIPTLYSEKHAEQKHNAHTTQVPECETQDSMLEELEEPRTYRGATDASEPQRQQNNEFRQAPANRFSAAFCEATKGKKRPVSEKTMIEEDIDTTPEVIEAHAAPVVRAVLPKIAALPPLSSIGADNRKISIDSTRPSMTSSRQLPPYSPPRSDRILKRARAMPSEGSRLTQQMPLSPEPITPNTQKAIPKEGGIALAYVPPETSSIPAKSVKGTKQYHQNPSNKPVTLANSDPPPKNRRKPETIRKYSEKGRQRYLEPKHRKCSGCRSCVSKLLPKDKRKRWIYICVTAGLLTIIAIALALAMTLTRRGDSMLVQTDWLNITGYPPIPTGISTIARPDSAVAKSGCVHPSTMWSCSVPKEQQAALAPNNADQPNFRIEIQFKNGTQGSSSNSTHGRKRSLVRVANAVSTSDFIRHRMLSIRDALSDTLYTPNPSPPSQEDQGFLGNTTDKITAPFDGEYTPFFISFLSTAQTPSSLNKRDAQNTTNTSDPFPDITSAIPAPDISSNGTASPVNLLPFPSAQPLRLYNRGLLTEHYGFYTYFDRSIFLKSTDVLNSTDAVIGDVPDDENGGATEDAATVRCTWTQTRFLVQIWTNRAGSANLLSPLANAPTPTSTTSSSTNPTQTSNGTISSANDFTRPGSFKYPITITLDRHGGDITKKMIYCYGMDDRERIISDEKNVQLEDRAFEGALVNPALGFAGNVNVSLADGGPGGIDGGFGGCWCQWQNWEGTR